MDKFNMYITFIILIKVGFVILAVSHLYLKLKHKDHTETDEKILFWKERLEFIFIALMAILLIYLFNPRTDRSVIIDNETKILLYLFGFILLITAKWSVFLHENPLFKKFQQVV
jgi:hypothetical protein